MFNFLLLFFSTFNIPKDTLRLAYFFRSVLKISSSDSAWLWWIHARFGPKNVSPHRAWPIARSEERKKTGAEKSQKLIIIFVECIGGKCMVKCGQDKYSHLNDIVNQATIVVCAVRSHSRRNRTRVVIALAVAQTHFQKKNKSSVLHNLHMNVVYAFFHYYFPIPTKWVSCSSIVFIWMYLWLYAHLHFSFFGHSIW